MSERQYPIAPNGIFWTLQGEGALSGEPMAFVRLAGCSVGCPECDTDYRVSQRLTVEEIIAAVRAVVPPAFTWPWVWITGGEPTDHDIAPLIDAFQTVGFRVALATSGVRAVPLSVQWLSVQWLSVSPHSDAIMQRSGHEIKIVPGLNGLTWDQVDVLARLTFPNRFLQPLAGDAASLVACRDFVLAHPGWRLTAQAHKGWNLP